ncbi:hypothetical protein BDW66DRAFT_137430 [Aspergillus desertorum]
MNWLRVYPVTYSVLSTPLRTELIAKKNWGQELFRKILICSLFFGACPLFFSRERPSHEIFPQFSPHSNVVATRESLL